MARFDNYRLKNLVRLLDLLAENDATMSDMRAIDQSCGTTFYTDLIYAREWPPYVTWFGQEDMVGDLVAEYIVDSLPDDEMGTLDERAGKLTGEPKSLFTPASDADLRAELRIDEIERGWLGTRSKISLKRELKSRGLSNVRYARITSEGQNFLAYAMIAAQKLNWPLAAFCLSEFVRREFSTRFILMKQRAESNGLRYDELDAADVENSLADLLKTIEPNADLTELGKFCLWSFGGAHFVQDASCASNYVESALDFVARVEARVWPSPEHVRHFAELILTESGEGPLLKALVL